MTAWTQRWDAARLDGCEAGHSIHERITVPVDLCPGVRPIPDGPAVPHPVRFDFCVFDAAVYEGTDAYCTGDDELSRSMVEQGCWEPWQTALAVDILAGGPPGTVIDLGSHVGWYSMLALAFGHRVFALDADTEHVVLSVLNATLAGWRDRFDVAVGWLDDDSTPLSVEETGPVRLVKIDLEGKEGTAAEKLGPLLAEGAVDYALVELSPEFGDGWRDALDVFAAAGYSAHLLPDKGDDVTAFEFGPLADTLRRPRVPPDLAVQATVLMVAP